MNLQMAPPELAATGALPPAQASATVLGGNPNGFAPAPQPGQMSQPQPLQTEQHGGLPMR